MRGARLIGLVTAFLIVSPLVVAGGRGKRRRPSPPPATVVACPAVPVAQVSPAVVATPAKPLAESPVATVPPQAFTEEMLADLERIRRQQGNPLKGTVFDKPTASTEFFEMYERSYDRRSSVKTDLRATARELEARAAQLEVGGMFQTADELRDHARRLWQEARRPDPDPTPLDAVPLK